MFSFDFLALPQNVWQEWAGTIFSGEIQSGIGQEFLSEFNNVDSVTFVMRSNKFTYLYTLLT